MGEMMTETEMEWVELHAPLFLAGTNLGQKLDPTKRAGLKLIYNEEKKHLYVSYNSKVARIPETSVLTMVEGKSKPVVTAKAPSQPIVAQVSTPTSHVFDTKAAGKTGLEEAFEQPKRGRPKKVGEQDHD